MSKKNEKIIVNLLTMSRLLGALFLPIIFIRVDMTALIILLSILFFTDFLDGKLSRYWSVQTMAGSLLDPLGDKMLAISCILSLLCYHKTLFLLIILELSICLLNILRTFRGEKVRSSFIGKFKTWILSITLIFGAINVFYPNFLNALGAYLALSISGNDLVNSMIMITCGVELVTIVSYMKESFDNRKAKVQKVKLRPIKEILHILFDENRFKEDRNKPLIEIIKK